MDVHSQIVKDLPLAPRQMGDEQLFLAFSKAREFTIRCELALERPPVGYAPYNLWVRPRSVHALKQSIRTGESRAETLMSILSNRQFGAFDCTLSNLLAPGLGVNDKGKVRATICINPNMSDEVLRISRGILANLRVDDTMEVSIANAPMIDGTISIRMTKRLLGAIASIPVGSLNSKFSVVRRGGAISNRLVAISRVGAQIEGRWITSAADQTEIDRFQLATMKSLTVLGLKVEFGSLTNFVT